MIKKLFILSFTIFITLNLFAESHDIHNQITDIYVEIEKVKKDKEINTLKEDIRKIEKKIEKNNDSTILNKEILDFLKEKSTIFLSEVNLLNKNNVLNQNRWSPSDIATVIIAFLTALSVLSMFWSSRSQINELKIQNKEHKKANDANLKLLIKEQQQQFNAIQLNHLEKKIENILISLETIERELNIFIGSNIDLSKLDDNKYKCILFAFKFQSMIVLINKALNAGYDLEILRDDLGRYAPIAKIFYNKKIIDYSTYHNFKLMIASSVHIGCNININLIDKFTEELKIELGSFNKDNILNIKYNSINTKDDLIITFTVDLKDGSIYKRDEKGKWNINSR